MKAPHPKGTQAKVTRNGMVLCAFINGASFTTIAEVFDLSPSRVRQIVHAQARSMGVQSYHGYGHEQSLGLRETLKKKMVQDLLARARQLGHWVKPPA